MPAEPLAQTTLNREESLGRRLAISSVAVGVLLAAAKIYVGLRAQSHAVLSDGLEAAGDVLSSCVVFLGLWIASKPPDAEHPYGHGRYETLSGLAVGAMLLLTGAAILWHGVTSSEPARSLPFYTLYPLFASILLKVGLAAAKLRIGSRIASTALRADAWHDLTDLLSTGIALFAVILTLIDPARFGGADRVGSIIIGIVILFLSARVTRQTMDQLVDTMPEPGKMAQIRRSALSVKGSLGIEKCYARRSGMRYHVDLHLEVDPDMTVRQSHEIATEVRFAIKRDLPWVADVLVHVEPSPLVSNALPTRAQRERIHGK
ncbi:MAG TPA: cation diffusion facilitator family transporter [Bryobacteraceae bacterium]|jgi:cation diffusion facilitator family transporter|nr:cation diffusion facilitator family transporter [Bryobacteraceae bacterium]